MKSFLRRIVVFLLLLLSFFSNGFCQKTAARIDFEVRGMANVDLLFGSEYLDKQIVFDTIRLNNSGEGTFASSVRLRPGVYVVTFPDQRYVELLIDDEQFFSVYSDTASLFDSLQVVGAVQPALFLSYQKLEKKLEGAKSPIDSKDKEQLQSKLKTLKDSVVNHMPGSFLAAYFRLLDLGRYSIANHRELSPVYFIQHQLKREKAFIDNFPFNDNRLLHSRLLFEQLSYFFNVFISQHPDTLIKRMDLFLSKAKTDENMYKYMLAFFNQNYRHCRTAEYEKVYVYLAENYYLNGKAPWADRRFIAMLEKKVNQIRSSVVGTRASDLILYTPDEKPVKLYNLSAKNIILFFWDADCEICTRNYLRLAEFIKTYRRSDLQVVAIYVHSNKQPWLEYISKYSAPFVHVYDPLKKSNFIQLYRIERVPYFYLLNQDKIIVSKASSVDSIMINIKK